MKVALPMLFGIVMGLMMALAGLTILNTQIGVDVIVDNPMHQAPIVSMFAGSGILGPAEYEQGITLQNVNNMIFMGYLLSLAVILFTIGIVMFFMMFWFGQEIPFMYLTFATFCIITFILVYWLGSVYMMTGV